MAFGHRPAGVGAGMPQFRGAAAEAQETKAPAWLLAGPAETGKTFAALTRLDHEARQYPRSQWAIVRKLRSTMDGTVLATWRRIIAPDVTPYGGERPQWYDYPNGARVWVGGLDNPDKILSAERDGIYVNQAEELSEQDWETLSTRTTGRGAITPHPMLFGDCNPGPEDHWIVRRSEGGALQLLQSKHEDNPTLFDEEGALTSQGQKTMRVLDALTGVRYQRLRLGRWVGAEGQFYTQLSEALHLREYPRIPAGQQVWGALDYGFVHPFSFGLFGYYEGAVTLFGRLSAHHWYVPQIAQEVDSLLFALGVARSGLRIVAGHDCWASRGGDEPETIADAFSKYGLTLERATIARIPGWRAIGERLGNAESSIPPSLFFNTLHGGRAVFDALARMVHDPHNAEDILKVNADQSGRGGDDDADMCRYGVMDAPTYSVGFSLPYDDRRKSRRL